MTSTIVPAMAAPASQPARNMGPFVRARGVLSIRMIAMIGTGLIATPIASGKMSPTALPNFFLLADAELLHGDGEHSLFGRLRAFIVRPHVLHLDVVLALACGLERPDLDSSGPDLVCARL